MLLSEESGNSVSGPSSEMIRVRVLLNSKDDSSKFINPGPATETSLKPSKSIPVAIFSASSLGDPSFLEPSSRAMLDA